MSDETFDYKAKILICEDEVIIAADLAARLKGLGYLVCGQASTVEQAIELTEKHQPDLVLMDIVLQGDRDGIDAAKEIGDHLDVPVVFLSAYTEKHRLDRAKLTSPFGYILKPFQDRDLKVTLEMALYVAEADSKRKKAEAALRQSEEKYRQVASNIPGTLYQFRLDVDGSFTFPFISEGVRELFGLSPKEVISNSIALMDLVHENDQQLVHDGIAASAKRMESYDLEHRIRSTDGETKWIRATSTPHLQEDGSVLWNGVATDITSRKMAEETLAKKTRLLEKAEQIADLGSWEWDMVQDVGVFSNNWQRIHGATGDSFASTEAMAFVHPDDAPMVEDTYRRVWQEGQPYDIRHHIIRADTTEVRHVRSSGEVEYCPETGKAFRMVGVSLDITNQLHKENYLLQANYAIDSSLAGIALSNIEGVLIRVNPAFINLWGYSSEDEILGRHASEFWDDTGKAHEILAKLNIKQDWEGWLQGIRSDKTRFTARVLAAPLLDSAGDLVGFTASFLDESERLATEKELADSEKKARALMNATTDAVVLLSPEGLILDLNDEYARRLGLDRSEMTGRNVWGFFPTEIAERRREEVQGVIDSGRQQRFLDERQGLWSDYIIHPLTNDDGIVTEVAVFAHDVTELMVA